MRLAEDHENATYLAQQLQKLGFSVTAPHTNIVYVDVPEKLVTPLKAHLESRGVLASVAPRMRLVTHLDLSRAQIELALEALQAFPQWAHAL